MKSLYDEIAERNHEQAIALQESGLAWLGSVRDPAEGKSLTTFTGQPEDFVRMVLAAVHQLEEATGDDKHVISRTLVTALASRLKKERRR